MVSDVGCAAPALAQVNRKVEHSGDEEDYAAHSLSFYKLVHSVISRKVLLHL